MKILVIEDDFSFALGVEILIEELGYQHLGTLDNAKDALRFIEENKPDLILMDIDLNGFLSGIDIARKISDNHIPVIFMTTYSDEKIYKEAMQVNPYGYIVKPFNKISLKSHIDRTFRKELSTDAVKKSYADDCFFVKVNEVLKKVNYDEVYWIQSDRNYVDIHLKQRRYSAKISLARLQEQLKADSLIRVHKQFIVNLHKVESYDENEVVIKRKNIPLGAKFKVEFLDKLNQL